MVTRCREPEGTSIHMDTLEDNVTLVPLTETLGQRH